MGSPVGGGEVTPLSCMSEFAERRYAERWPRGTPIESVSYVLFRPKEVHAASRENDVIPPERCWHEATEHEAVWVRATIAYCNFKG